MKSKRFVSMIAAVAGLFYAGVANANLIVNGDFETGAQSPWIMTGNVLQVGPVGSPFWFGAGSSTQDGNFAIAFNAGNLVPDGKISQVFATVAGTTYMVQFDYGATQGGTQQVSASVMGSDGVTVLNSQIASAVNPPSALSTFSFLFTANGNQSTLQFTDYVSNNTYSLDGVLDNVSASATTVPAPATMLLLGPALAGLGLLRRKFMN